MIRPLLRTTLAATVLVSSLGRAADSGTVTLPDLGDASVGVISPAQERKLGEDFMRRARRSLAFLDDPELNDYIQSLGSRLVAAADTPSRDFHFFLVNDPTINAFAVPGGFIGVHTGLILAATSEGELASVLAHETAHVTQRHIPRLVAEQQRASLPAMAALLASVLLAAAGKSGAEAGIVASQAALAQQGINFTRSFEEEADRIGMAMLAKSGFDPNGMPAFFERMQNLNRANETSLPEFLRTHPVTTNRIADARNRAAQLSARPRPDSSEFHHARARIRALVASDPREAAREFRANLAQGRYRDADAERYGLAVSLLRAKDIEAARSEAKQLAARQPSRLGYQTLRAEIELAGGQVNEGLAIYNTAHRRHPDNAPLLRSYAAALLRAGKPRETFDLLRPVIRRSPNDPTLYRIYGQAAGEIGERVEAHRALGEYHYLNGNPGAAIQQLEIARRSAGNDFYLLSSIEARIGAIKDEIALYQEEKGR
jgi:predicted Zn-dependent protease